MKETISIQNLKCGGCETSVKVGLEKLEGVEKVIRVDAETGEVELELSENLDVKSLKDKLNKMGYPMVDDENTLGMKIKSYASCMVGRVTKE